MAPGFRSPLPLDSSRSYCFSDADGHRWCGPRTYVEEIIRWRLASGERPNQWIHTLDPMTQQLVNEVREQMWHDAVERAVRSAAELRANVVRIANREYASWNGASPFTERSREGRRLVRTYWREGVRRSVSDAQAASATWQDKNPWSSAFISYVLRAAGAGGDFRYAWAHAVYIRAAIDNRIQGASNTFKGYRVAEVEPEPGDIVAKEREGSGANYDNVRRGMNTHGDIVTEVHHDHIVAIGGNVNQNVDRKELSLDGRGRLSERGYFVVIKIEPVIPSRELF